MQSLSNSHIAHSNPANCWRCGRCALHVVLIVDLVLKGLNQSKVGGGSRCESGAGGLGSYNTVRVSYRTS
jgi:hypothetical protein